MTYPEIPERATWAIDLIFHRMEEDPEFLMRGDVPYGAEDLDFLERYGPIGAEEEEIEELVSVEDKWRRLQTASDDLFKALTQAGKELEKGDSSEKMAYFRTATSLLDKIVGIQERAANLQQVHRFYATVLDVMEEVLEPGQRTAAMERLKLAVKQGESN